MDLRQEEEPKIPVHKSQTQTQNEYDDSGDKAQLGLEPQRVVFGSRRGDRKQSAADELQDDLLDTAADIGAAVLSGGNPIAIAKVAADVVEDVQDVVRMTTGDTPPGWCPRWLHQCCIQDDALPDRDDREERKDREPTGPNGKRHGNKHVRSKNSKRQQHSPGPKQRKSHADSDS